MANASAYRLSFVLCKATGEPFGEAIGAAGRTLERRLNTPAVATVALQLEDPFASLITPSSARLKIYRSATRSELDANPAASNVLVWYGSLPAEGVTEDTDTGLMTLAFQDPRWVLRSRYLTTPAVFAATDQSTIISSVLATQNARSNTWVVVGGSTGVLRDRTYDQGMNVAQLVDELTQVTNGCDVDVAPSDGYAASRSQQMGTLTITSRQGTDRPNTVFYYTQQPSGQGGGNLVGVKSSYAPIYNVATAQGTAPDGTSSAQTFNVATGGDLLETYTTASNAYTAAGLLEAAAGVVAENSRLRRIVEVGAATWDAPLPFVDYDLGDTVRLTVRRGSLKVNQAVMRVMGYDVAVDQEGNLVTRPVLVTA